MSNKLPIARQDDTTYGYCSAHDGYYPGTITTFAGRTKCEGKYIARDGDVATASCGHTGTINSSLSSVVVEGQPIARKDDSFSGTYSGTITGGASKTFAGD